MAHAEPVGDGVGGDENAGAERERDRRALYHRGATPAERQARQPARDQHDPGQLRRPQPLADERRGEPGHQQRRYPTGQRVHLAEVAKPVAAHQHQLVADVQARGGGDERPARRRRGRDRRDGRQAHGDAGDVDEHEADELVVDRLGQAVPEGVQDGGEQHRADHDRRDGGGHGGSFRPGSVSEHDEQEPSGLFSPAGVGRRPFAALAPLGPASPNPGCQRWRGWDSGRGRNPRRNRVLPHMVSASASGPRSLPPARDAQRDRAWIIRDI